MFSLWHSELDLCSIIATFCNAKSKRGKCQQKQKKRAKTKTKEINNNNKNETKTLKKPPTKPISMKVAIFGGVWKKMLIVMWVVLLRLLKSIFGSDVDVCDRNTVRRRHNRSTVFWNRKACLDNVSALLASSTKSVLRY